MGRVKTGKVKNAFIKATPGFESEAQYGFIEIEAGNKKTHQFFGPSNEDFAPPFGIDTLVTTIGRGGGFLVSYAFCNPMIQPVALPGEKRIYSTNENGDTVMAEIFLKNDGTILLKNSKASITMAPDGTVSIVNDGNTEITSAKTVINNDVDIKGKLDVAQGVSFGAGGSMTGNIDMIDGIIIGPNVFNGPDSDKHLHGEVVSGTEDTGVPK